jgi:predicted DNA-binding protein (MmcQ/YjbR family)
MARALRQLAAALRRYALGLPGAYEEFPWGEPVFKVRGKIFLFLGTEPGEVSVTVKLPRSSGGALMLPYVEPTGYGLFRSGWVSATITRDTAAPLALLLEWIDESYAAVAPKGRRGAARLSR